MRIHQSVARFFGYELINQKKHPNAFSHLKNLIHQYQIDLVLDVGANKGQFGKGLRKQGYKGEICSFEPIAEVFEELSKVCRRDPLWTAHRKGMGCEIGEKSIKITESSDLSSFLDANDFGARQYEKIRTVREENVAVDTVDNFLTATIPDFAERKILLKMDTQGYDLKVFEGAKESLPNITAVVSEISFIPLYSGMPDYLDSLRNYGNAGFDVTGLYAISRKKDLSVIEMDCILISNRLSKLDADH